MKRLARVALAWTVCVALMLAQVPLNTLSAFAQNESSQGAQTANASDGSASLGTLAAEIADEQARADDVEITDTDVPVQNIEWEGDGTSAATLETQATDYDTGETHSIVLVLDTSGSMSGDPMTELKKACNNFIDDILAEDSDAQIAIVNYAGSVTTHTFSGDYFTSTRSSLRSVISSLSANGNTAMNAGLQKAIEIMNLYGDADKQYVLQMADGMPNVGDTYSDSDAHYLGSTYTDPDGESFTYSGSSRAYASAVYNTYLTISDVYYVYSLGFFHDLSGTTKQFAATFMNDIQNQSYYEVTDADLVAFSFETIAQDISTERLVLNKSALTMEVGDSETLSLSFTDAYTASDTSVKWGTSNTLVATVDNGGTVTAVGSGSCTITAEAGGFYVTCAVTVAAKQAKVLSQSVTVYENQNSQTEEPSYVLSEGATITYDGDTYTTSSNGSAKLPDIESDVTVGKDGFVSQTLSADQIASSMTVYLEKQHDGPTIQSVWVNDVDILHDEYSLSITEGDATVIAADVDWASSSYGSIELVQGSTSVAFDDGKYYLSLVLSEQFDISGDLYLRVTDADGTSVQQELLFTPENLSNLNLNGLSFSLGDSIELTLPDGLPLLGSSKVKLSDFDSALPVEVKIDDGTVYIAIGVYVDKFSTKNGEEDADAKSVAKAIKNALGSNSSSSISTFLNSYGDAVATSGGSFGFDADFTALGYIEGIVNENNEFEAQESGMVLNPSVSSRWSGQFTVGPVPCYWEAAIAAELEARLALYQASSSVFLPAGSVDVEVEGDIGAGVGVNEVATIGGGGTAKFNPWIEFYSGDADTYFKLTTTLGVYFKVKVLAFEYIYKPEVASVEWVVDNGAEASSLSTEAACDEVYGELYDTSSYALASLSYLEGNDIAIASADVSSSGSGYATAELVLDAAGYEETEPEIVQLSGSTKLAVWVDSPSDDANDIQLYFSYYDGASWSDPALVDDDGTADFSPELCVANGRAYVVWQDLEATMDDESSLEDLAGHTGISVATFSTSSESFSVTSLSEGDGYLDMQPCIAANGSTVTVAWVRNTDNEWFGSGYANNIVTRTLSSSSWGSESVYASGLASVNSLAIQRTDDGLDVAYVLDGDEDLSTLSDLELYVNGAQLTDDDVLDCAPSFSSGSLYWYSDGVMCCAEDMDDPQAEQLLSDDVTLLSDGYRIVESDGNKAIVYTVPDGYASELYGVFYDEDEDAWGEPVQLTDEGGAISSFAAFWEDDELKLLCNCRDLANSSEEADEDGNVYGDTDLVYLSYSSPAQVSISACLYDAADILPSSVLPITLSVKNEGMETLEGVRVQMLDGDGEVLSTVDYSDAILSGCTSAIEFDYLVASEDIGEEYTIQCIPLPEAEEGSTEHADDTTIEFAYEDLELQDLTWGMTSDGNVLVYGQLANLGFTAQSDITVALHEGSVDGTTVSSYTISSLGSLSSSDVSFEIAYDANTLYYVTVSEGEGEATAANNYGFVYVKSSTRSTGRTVEALSVSKSTTDYKVGDTLDVSDVVVIASYDDGSTADVTGYASIDVSAVNMNKAGTYTMTVSYGSRSALLTVTVSGTSSGTDAAQAASKTKVGSTFTSGNLVYRIKGTTAGKRTVAVVKPTKKTVKKVKVPATVKVNGKAYKVTVISAKAFSGCKKLRTVTIGKNVKTIAASAFKNCSALKKVVIPAKVSSIGKRAFSGCKKLTSVTFKTKKLGAKGIGKKAFAKVGSSNYKKLKIKVPKSKKALYKKLLKKAGLSAKAKVK